MIDKFLTERNVFASKLGVPDLFDYIDHFSLFAGAHTLGNKIFTYEILKKTAGIPGDIAEFGCWKGSNLMFLAKILTLLEPNSPKKVALDLIEDSLSVGGAIVFDEALTAEWPGETLAMKEYIMHSKRKFRMITNTLSRQPTLALIRIE